MNSFLDAAESVLAIYGVWPHGDLEAFEHPRPEGHDDNGVYDFLHINPERYANLTNDANMVFMEKSFNGNLYQGLHYTEQLFNHEMDRSKTRTSEWVWGVGSKVLGLWVSCPAPTSPAPRRLAPNNTRKLRDRKILNPRFANLIVISGCWRKGLRRMIFSSPSLS